MKLEDLRPAALPPELLARLRLAEPAPAPRRRPAWLPLAAPCLAIAAVLLAATFMPALNTPPAPTPSREARASDLRIFVPAARQATQVRVGECEVVGRVSFTPVEWIDDVAYIGDDRRSILHEQTPRRALIAAALEEL